MPTVNDASGEPAKVTDGGKLETYSVTESEGLHVNEEERLTFSALVDVTTATTDDDFFYLQNTSDKDLIITRVEGWCDDANQEIKVVLGAVDDGTGAGDAIVPGNMNASGNIADCVCTQDATDLAITGGTVVSLLKFPVTPLERAEFVFPEGIILPKNQRLHMEAALAGLINMGVYFYYHD